MVHDRVADPLLRLCHAIPETLFTGRHPHLAVAGPAHPACFTPPLSPHHTAAAQIAETNEFAVIYGDHYSFNPSFVPRAIAAGQYNAVGFVGHSGGLQLKEYYIRQFADTLGTPLTDAQFASLKEVLEKQGIVVLETK